MLGASISKNSVLLGIFALITAGVLAGTYLMTRDRIQLAERAAAQRALFDIVPEERHTNDLLTDTLPIPKQAWIELGLKDGGDLHVARRNDEIVAIILPAVAPDGYSGDIRMIVGVNRDGSVAGVRILSHRETPGLGDKVDLNKSNWVLDFDGKSLTQPQPSRWRVKKDGGEFDQFTGATITPRAVINQVRRALEFVEVHREQLFPPASDVTEDSDSMVAIPAQETE